MSKDKWVEEEIKRAIDSLAGEDDPVSEHAIACYQAAAEIMDVIEGQMHSGLSVLVTMEIVNNLVKGIPLTPLTGEDDEWNEVTLDNDGTRIYQNRRKSSVFKSVSPDGAVFVHDNDNIVCFNPGSNTFFYSGFVSSVVSELYQPITFPYVTPARIEVCVDEFLSKYGDPKHDDFDTIGILYSVKNGKRTEINHYFKSDAESWTEISKEEYEDRRKKNEM